MSDSQDAQKSATGKGGRPKAPKHLPARPKYLDEEAPLWSRPLPPLSEATRCLSRKAALCPEESDSDDDDFQPPQQDGDESEPAPESDADVEAEGQAALRAFDPEEEHEAMHPVDPVDDEWADGQGLRLELISLLEADDLELVERVLEDANVPGRISDETFRRLDDLEAASREYRQDDRENWEVVLEDEARGLAFLARLALNGDADEEELQRVKSVLNGKNYRMIRQRPGGGDEVLADIVVRLLNSVKNGFCFIAAADLKIAWLDILLYLTPYFRSGGRLLVTIPLHTIGSGLLRQLQSWRDSIAAIAGPNGGFRYLFVTDYEREVSHGKEFSLFFSGGSLVKGIMSANLSGPGFGIGVLKASTKAGKQQSDQSAELLELTLLNLTDSNEIATDYLASLSNYYISHAKLGRLTVPVPALESVYLQSLDEQRALEYAKARNSLVAGVGRSLRGTYRATQIIQQIEAQQQLAISLATTAETEEASESGEPIEGEDDRASDSEDDGDGDEEKMLKKREKHELRMIHAETLRELKALDQAESLSKEEKAEIRQQALEDLKEERPEAAELYEECFGGDAGPAKPPTRKRKPGARRARKSNADGSTDSDDSNDGIIDMEPRKRRRVSKKVVPSDGGGANGSKVGTASSTPPPTKDKKGRVRYGDECYFCGKKRGETGGQHMTKVDRFLDQTSCAACKYRLTSGDGLTCSTLDEAKEHCMSERPRHPRTTAPCCSLCGTKGDNLRHWSVNDDKRTLCRNCHNAAQQYAAAESWLTLWTFIASLRDLDPATGKKLVNPPKKKRGPRARRV